MIKIMTQKQKERDKAYAEWKKADDEWWKKAYAEWWKKAYDEWRKADAEWDKATQDNKDELLKIHAELCPDCPANGETIFTRKNEKGEWY